ncbi:MAG: hypothetical protein JWQ63_1679 [Mucilaginibacter sp.]|nr:hypothetical protein [Mucilaginibacter sp.]
MNIDELKDAWNQDEPKGMHLPVTTAMLGKTTSAIEKIRKNMKTEFIACLVCYVMLIILLFTNVQSSFFFNVASIFVFIILVLNCFYFFRFYIFYKSISRYNYNIKNSIRKITYELELNTEIYKTYNFCVTPLAVLGLFILLCGKKGLDYSWKILASNASTFPVNLLFVFLIILASFTITYICINSHIRLQYGKYLADLKQVMNDLGDED